MGLIPNSIGNKYKKIVDTAAYLYEANKIILHQAGLQHKCLFECVIYPEQLTLEENVMNKAKSLMSTAMDIQLMRTYLYAINDIQLIGFEYERYGGFNVLLDAVYPDTISMTFLETQIGLVKRYFRTWLDSIAIYDETLREYVFNDNQIVSKRTALIIPQQKDYLPSLEWIKIEGLKIKSITGIDYSHENADIEQITIEFSVDNVRLINKILS